MANIQEISFEGVDLASEIEELIGNGKVKAHYHAGEWVEVHGTQRLLSIALLNTDLNDAVPELVDQTIAKVADVARDWLSRKDLLETGTLISIVLMRHRDLVVLDLGRSVGGRAFRIGANGELLNDNSVTES